MARSLVTDKHQQGQHLAGASHTVTRSRGHARKNREQEKYQAIGLKVCSIEHSERIADSKERAAILEFNDNHGCAEAKRPVGFKTVAALGPLPNRDAR
ncbi:hypothetical protein ACQVP2_19960 [Methylobacterium aquaticum]|uniref:hypothetical protein n=1 Tax=Methylobacterium aquaticum TaxID=270351 RepID=UPI003D1738ED